MMRKQKEKRTYEISRVKGFNDAVFAIAITLLVLDIHPEVAKAATNAETWSALKDALPSIASFALSFWIIHAFWSGNNRMFQRIKLVDSSIIRLNALLLFGIALLPFPTSFLAGHSLTQASVTLYAGTLCALLLTQVAILYRLYAHTDYLEPSEKATVRQDYIAALATTAVFVLAIVVAALIRCWPFMSLY
jgi:uncharacterized membrane protein